MRREQLGGQMKLNLGCGSVVPDGWVNVDYAIGARLARVRGFRIINRKIKLFKLDWDNRIIIHNLTKRFPWDDESARAVYTSHTLEHFVRRDGLAFLKECHRVLRNRGIIRIVVPDLACIVRDYSEAKIRADQFLEQLHVLYSASQTTFRARLAPFIEFPHKCMYDVPTLLRVLHEVGFKAESRKPFDSDIEDIRRIELEERTENAAIVEGRREQ